jgi:hypothetical protein
MSPGLPHIKFNAGAFGHTFVARRARRWLQQQFDALGEKAIIYTVENNKSLLDYIPLEMRAKYKIMAKPYQETFPGFTNDEVYSWIPEEWRMVIESIPGGKEWGLRQVEIVRQFAMS